MEKKRKHDVPKNKDPIRIVADDRERKSEVIDSLSGFEDVNVSIQRLAIGDYQIDNRLIVERKTLRDYAVSIIDARLFKQMIRLANSTLRGVLILEGTTNDLGEPGVTREAMQGALITVSLILGIPVLRSKDPFETAKLIVYSARQIQSLARGGVHTGTATDRKINGNSSFLSCRVCRGSAVREPTGFWILSAVWKPSFLQAVGIKE